MANNYYSRDRTFRFSVRTENPNRPHVLAKSTVRFGKCNRMCFADRAVDFPWPLHIFQLLRQKGATPYPDIDKQLNV